MTILQKRLSYTTGARSVRRSVDDKAESESLESEDSEPSPLLQTVHSSSSDIMLTSSGLLPLGDMLG